MIKKIFISLLLSLGVFVNAYPQFGSGCTGSISGPDKVCAGQSIAYSVGNYNLRFCNWYVTGKNTVNSNGTISWGSDLGKFRIDVACSCGGSPANISMDVTVEASTVSGGTVNGAQTICYGLAAAPLTAENYSGYITRWEKRRPTETNWNFVGSTSRTLPTDFIDRAETFDYRVLVTNNCGSSSFSSSARVTVVNVPTPAIPTKLGIDDCGPQTLSVSVPSGVTWYWQGTSSNGQDESKNASSNFIAESSGTYYVGAKLGSCWSYSSLSVTVKPLPQEPNLTHSFDVTTNSCGPRYISIPTATLDALPSGVTWHWQGRASDGKTLNPIVRMSSGNYMNNSYPADIGTASYYIRALGSNSCWSSQLAVTSPITANAYPDLPPVPADITVDDCGPRTLSVSGTPQGGVTWYWQGMAANGRDDSASKNASLNPLVAESSGTYYVGAKLGSCWSYSSLSVTVKPLPQEPNLTASFNVTNELCGPRYISIPTATLDALPSGVTWHWQGRASDGKTLNPIVRISSGNYMNNSYPADIGTASYYIRALGSNSCWSSQLAVTSPITANAYPDLPPVPADITVDDCGPQTLSVSGTPASGVSWYWQGMATDGKDESDSKNASSNPLVVESSGTYYVGAKFGSCWSYSSLPVTVKPLPAPPLFGLTRQFCGFAKVSKSTNEPNWYWLPDASSRAETNNANEIEITASGPVFLGSKSAEGCWLVIRQDITVENTAPIFSISPERASICGQGIATFQATASSQLSFIWYDKETGDILKMEGSEFTTPVLNQSGFFKVIGFNENGCSSEHVWRVDVSAPVTKVPNLPILERDASGYLLHLNNSNDSEFTFNWVNSPVDNEFVTYANPRPVIGGYYYLKARNQYGCFGKAVQIEVPDFQPSGYDLLDPQNVSYIKTYSYQTKNVTEDPDLLLPEQVQTNTQFFDGIGRVFQTNSKAITPGRKDLISITDYDHVGRVAITPLPYATFSNSGDVQNDPFTGLTAFYTNTEKVASSNFPFAYKRYDQSPLNDVLEEAAPGQEWVGTLATPDAKTIKKNKVFNQEGEVFLFTVDVNGLILLDNDVSNRFFPPNQLYANKTIDEQGHEVIEYVDKEGQTVCKKVEASGSGSSKVYASTYYVYDNLGNLAVVLPPEGVKELTK